MCSHCMDEERLDIFQVSYILHPVATSLQPQLQGNLIDFHARSHTVVSFTSS